MMGNMHSPEKAAKMVNPVFNIERQVLQDEKRKPIQKRAEWKINKMKPEDRYKNNYIHCPEDKVDTAIKKAQIDIDESIFKRVVLFQAQMAKNHLEPDYEQV